jgi:hypothetical protein
LLFKVYKELSRLLCQKGRIRPGQKVPDLAPELYCGFFLYHFHDPAQDLEQLREFEALFAEKGYCEETVRAARPNCLNMIVVKLNSGGLLLYCPVQVTRVLHPTILFPCQKCAIFFSVVEWGSGSGSSISSESGYS